MICGPKHRRIKPVEWRATCIEDHAGATGTHPFVWNHNNWVLVFQGLARIAQGPAMEERLLRAILSRPILDGLLAYLRGEGGNPNLLLDIYDA